MLDRKRILIIDDDAMFRNLLMTHLRKDYVVAVSNDGKDGYNKARSHRPDVVIIDIQMPGWDGIETLKAFREDDTLKQVKAIMLTGDASRDTVMSAIRSGANEYMIKSVFNKVDLLAKVSKLINSIPPFVVTSGNGESSLAAKQMILHKAEESKPEAHHSGVSVPDNTDQLISEVLDNWE